ncbi:MAG TPA: PAS domain-containing protein, partial [Nannocystis sp.]
MTEEEGGLRRLVDALPHLVWVRRPDGELAFVNAAWSRYAGLSGQLPAAAILARAVHPDDHTAMVLRHQEACAVGEAYELEVRVCRHDGAFRWHRARVEPVRDASGQIERWVGSASEVHGIRETRERLEHAYTLASALVTMYGDDEARAQLDALFEGATIGLALLDRELRFVRINRVLAELTGIAPGEDLGRAPGDIAPDLAPLAELLRQVLHTGAPVVDARFSFRGERAWYVSSYPVRVRGVVTGVAAIIVDLTERVRAEQGYELVGRATNDAIRDSDLGTGETRWNAAISTLFGYPKDEVGPDLEWWRARIHPEDRDRVAAGVARALAEGTERWVDEYRFARRDGTFARVLDRAWIARDPSGRPTRMVASMFDVTEHRSTEAERAAILDASPIGFAVLDRELRYRRVNRALAALNNQPVEV